jgi:hypothetical protein
LLLLICDNEQLLETLFAMWCSCDAGTTPVEFPDPFDLALLRATQAGVLTVASAGNSGPGLGTAENLAPW